MMKSIVRYASVAALTLSTGSAFLAFAGEGHEAEESGVAESALPAPVAATVKATMPGAAFLGAGMEREHGAEMYEVKVKTADGREVEVAVRADGQLVETGEEVDGATLPAPVAHTLANILSSGKTVETERKEFVLFEMKKEIGETTYELVVDANGRVIELSTEHEDDHEGHGDADDEDGEEGDDDEAPVAEAAVPAPVLAAAKSALPGASFEKAAVENEDGRKVYELMLKTTDGRHVEVMVGADGHVTETEEQLKESALPSQVAATVANVLPGGKTEELERKLVVAYEVKKVVGSTTYEVLVGADGEVLFLHTEGEHGEE